MLCGTEVGLGPATLLGGDPATAPRQGAHHPTLQYIVAKKLDGSGYHLVRRPQKGAQFIYAVSTIFLFRCEHMS